MRPIIRNAALTLFLAATTLAGAQTAQSSNPAARSDRDSFYYGAIHGAPAIGDPTLKDAGIGRPVGRYGPVTPVPEPSEWAMLLAGLAAVGFIVKRNARRP